MKNAQRQFERRNGNQCGLPQRREFQNAVLLSEALPLLRAEGFEIFQHSRVPANDGGVSGTGGHRRDGSPGEPPGKGPELIMCLAIPDCRRSISAG